MAKHNLVEMDFNHLDQDAKRYSFLLMDQELHELLEIKNKFVTDFEPTNIYYDDDTKTYSYAKVEEISPLVVNSKEEARVYDIIGLSTLAFCSYLPSYSLKNGLLDSGVISQKFDSFATIFNEDDRNYYREVLVNTRTTGKLPEPIYYFDYVKQKESISNSDSKSLGLSTAAGRAFSEKEKSNEAAFGDIFFFVTITASMLIGIGSLLIFFLK